MLPLDFLWGSVEKHYFYAASGLLIVMVHGDRGGICAFLEGERRRSLRWISGFGGVVKRLGGRVRASLGLPLNFS